MSDGLPERQTTLVVLKSATRSRSSSSISTLSLGPRITTVARRWFSLAVASSETMVKTRGDQPRIRVWFFSSTRERPLRSSSIFSSITPERAPIRVLITKMPPKVTASIEKRNDQLPVSPPMVPASRVRISDIQVMCDEAGSGGAVFGRRQVEQPDEGREDEDHQHGDHAQPDDQHRRAARERRVESVGKALTEGRFAVAHRCAPVARGVSPLWARAFLRGGRAEASAAPRGGSTESCRKKSEGGC